jgi:hypothetical protein
MFARDHHRCTAPGCRSARNLDIHHIIEQANGGTHELCNLCLLCSGHHSALHAGLLTMRGEAPYHIVFRWVYVAPIPVGLDPDARRAMITQRVREILEQTIQSPTHEPVNTGEPDCMRRPGWDVEQAEAQTVVQRGADG